MSKEQENYVLVRMSGRDVGSNVTQVIRTYLSRSRADQDMELLSEIDPASVYAIHVVAHIDD